MTGISDLWPSAVSTELRTAFDGMRAGRYAHGHQPAVVRHHARRTAETCAAFLLPHLDDTMRILDVGCGPGSITGDLAREVPRGGAVGVDVSQEVLELARQHWTNVGAANVDLEEGSVYGLPHDDQSFDIVYAHQVLQHLTDPVAALDEMRRVMRTGGLVAVRECDWYTMSRVPESPIMDQWRNLYQQVVLHNGAEPDAGRYLYRWLKDAGFTDITMSATCRVVLGEEDRSEWGESWAERCLTTDFASPVVAYGYATQAELRKIADDWRDWSKYPDGYLHFISGEGLAKRTS